MSLDYPRRAVAPLTATAQPDDAIIWMHAAFCGLALPVRAARGAWQREAGGTSIRIEPNADEAGLPSGRVLRLGMMRLCDAAVRANSPVVELGEDAGAVAAALGLDPKARDFAEQWQRMLGARILVSWDGGAEFGVFDARSRPRAGAAGWRSTVRLNSRFHASLMQQAVPLDRRVVRELAASPAAIDAYAWIRLCLRDAAEGEIATTTWDELLQRFGTPSQDMAGFRVAFEEALRMVFELDRSIALAVDEEGLSVRHATSGDEEAAAESAEPEAERLRAEPDVAMPAPPAPAAEPPAVAAAPATDTRDEPVAERAMPPESDPPVQHGNGAAAAPPSDRITQDSISLPRHLTGLSQVIWLRRGHGEDSILVGVTPSPRFEADRLTVLAVEPMVIQVSGGLYEQEFERVSAWVMTNRDVIDDFWDGRITSFAEINQRVRKAPAPGWR